MHGEIIHHNQTSPSTVGLRQFLEGLFHYEWKGYLQETCSRMQGGVDISKAIRLGWLFMFSI